MICIFSCYSCSICDYVCRPVGWSDGPSATSFKANGKIFSKKEWKHFKRFKKWGKGKKVNKFCLVKKSINSLNASVKGLDWGLWLMTLKEDSDRGLWIWLMTVDSDCGLRLWTLAGVLKISKVCVENVAAILRFCGGYTQFCGGYTQFCGGYTQFCGGYTV